ncbi:unnamed protein product [Jaminaea pallidilutea]
MADADMATASSSAAKSGELDDGGLMDATNGSSSSSSNRTLSPSAYTRWVRSAERKLIAAAKGYNQASDDLLADLHAAMRGKSEALVLNARQWKVWCATSLWELTSPSRSDSVSLVAVPDKIKAVLDLHQEATRASNGSALDLASFITYIHLLLSLHYHFEEISPPPSAFWEAGGGSVSSQDWSVASTEDFLQEWTGLRGGPKFLNLRHRRSKLQMMIGYERSSLPRIPTRRQAQAAGCESEWAALLSEEPIREAVREANSRAAGEVNWSHLLWNPLCQFELIHLQRDKTQTRVEAVKQVFMARLRVPHREHEATAQEFSMFVSQHMSPAVYESTMSTSQKAYGKAKALWTSIEGDEDRVLETTQDHEAHVGAWTAYLRGAAARRGADFDLTAAAFERCLASLGLGGALAAREEEEHAPDEQWESEWKKGRLKMKKEQRQAIEKEERNDLRSRHQQREGIWAEYITFLITARADASQLLNVVDRAARALPGSGLLWAFYLRSLAHAQRSKAHIDEIFARALEGGECEEQDKRQTNDGVEGASRVIDLLVGRIDAERHSAALALATEQGLDLPDALNQLPKDADRFMEIFALISYALGLPSSRPAAASDTNLRLQRLASSWAEAGPEGMASLAESIWESAVSQQLSNGAVWAEAAHYHARCGDALKARALFRQGAGRRDLSGAMELLEAWKRFETLYGSAEDIARIEDRCKRAAAKQWEDWAQYAQAQQEQYVASYGAQESSTMPNGMEVDGAHGQKRKANGEEDSTMNEGEANAGDHAEDVSKRERQGESKAPVRDRENSSVLVAGLPSDATIADVQRLFADCGSIREIDGPIAVGTSTSASAASSVEFMDRASIPAARTKDKKRVRGLEVAVSLGWQCTLYVTNFPASFDDAAIRQLFGNYGLIYNVRWPSKRYDTNRRFCYVQYTTADSARSALALHQHKLDDETTLQVFLSDPSRRKQRTDANAAERELYITGVSRSATMEELRPIFEAHGTVEDLRIPTSSDGRIKGLAFVHYKTPLEAQKAIAEVDGFLFKGKALHVQLVDPNRGSSGGTASNAAEDQTSFTARSIKVRGLPADAQEALVQQLFEHHAGSADHVKKVEWTPQAVPPQRHSSASSSISSASAIVEFDSASTAGRLLLLSGQVSFRHSSGQEYPLTLLPLERGAIPLGNGSSSSSRQGSGGPHSVAATAVKGTSSTKGTGTGGASSGIETAQDATPASFVPRLTSRGRGGGGGGGGGRGRGRGRGLGFAPSSAGATSATSARGTGGMDVDGGDQARRAS